MAARRAWITPVALVVVTLVLYAWRLDDSPIHLHYDEIFFGLQARSIQSTGRDLNGRLLPVYFQLENSFNWYQPMAVYWSALVLMIAPLSEAAVRFPTVLIAVANVMLMFFVTRRLTHSVGWSAVAALLLMLTPAHFIHSRLAMDYVYPLPFLLGWFWCVLGYLESPSPRRIAAATLCLGFGFFSYIAGTALAPLYVLATLALVWWLRRPLSDGAAAIAGFAVPVAAAAAFIAVYPETVPDLMQKYGKAPEAAVASTLDPFQRLREAFTARSISDGLNHYWRFYSPGYLFATGGANLTNSTRTTGVFLPPLAIFLIAGLVGWRQWGPVAGALLLFGFLTAPLPATLMPEEFTIDRELALLPFAVLIATIGVQRMWMARANRATSTSTTMLAALIAGVAILYSAWSLVQRGQLPATAPWLVIAAVVLYAVGVAVDRSRTWRPVAVLLVAAVPLLFVPFVRDYFGEYRERAAAWFGGNIRGAIEEIISLDAMAPATEIHISTDIPYIRSYWRFYLDAFDRQDLSQKIRFFDAHTLAVEAIPRNSYVLVAGNDHVAVVLGRSGLTRVAGATDPGLPEQFSIFRR